MARQSWGEWAARLVAASVLTAGGVGIEVYARMTRGPLLEWLSREAEYRVADFQLHHRLIPDADGHSITKEWNVAYHINSLGLRDHEYSLSPPSDVTRVLVLGDSYTEGFGVSLEQTYVKVLETKLNALAQQGRRYEVINGGMFGSSPLLEYLFLMQRGLQLQPNLVLLSYDPTDLEDDRGYEYTTTFDEAGQPVRCVPYKRVRAYSRHPIERWLIRHSMGYLYMENRLNKLLYKYRHPTRCALTTLDFGLAYREAPEAITDDWSRNQRYLGLMARALRERRIPLVVARIPFGVEVNSTEWSGGRQTIGLEKGKIYHAEALDRALETFAKQEGLVYLNVLPDLQASELHPLFYDVDGHLTADGHQVVAEALARDVMAGRLLSNE